MEEKAASLNQPTGAVGAQLIVRVKRRREDDPAETIFLFDDSHFDREPTSKRNKKSLTSEMSRAVTINEDTEKQQSGNADSSASKSRKRLILQRISTLEQFSYATIDQETASALSKKRGREDGLEVGDSNEIDNNITSIHSQATKKQRNVKLLVAQSKKTTSLSTSDDRKTSCVIVDTMQLFDSSESQQTMALTSNSSNIQTATQTATPTKKLILNPPTRLLSQAIVTAVTRNDFNDLSRALIQGGDINLQLDNSHATAGGYTALMAASQRGNLRILKRLLLDSSLTTVLAKNAQGYTALDLLPKPTNRTNLELQEMRQLLEQATIRQHQQEALRALENQRQQQRTQSAFEKHGESVFNRFAAHGSSTSGGVAAEDFVVDIYVVKNTESGMAEDEVNNKMENTDMSNEMNESMQDSDSKESENLFSILRVEGLRIDDETGQVELVAYDSDWSDLADDEEPDSNDERHYANDYPDESDDDNGGRLFADMDRDSDDDNEDSDNDDDDVGMGSKLNRRQRRRRGGPSSSKNAPGPAKAFPSKSKVSFPDSMDIEENYEGEAENLDDMNQDEESDIEMDIAKQMSQFFGTTGIGNKHGPDVTTLFDGHRNHVSRIMRPFQLDESNSRTGHTTESLQELWDTEGSPRDAAVNDAHGERVEHMRERTGMIFAANVHEFDRETGIPKYGQELSDDDGDLIAHGYGRGDGEKPPGDTPAYDSELDGDD